MSKNIFLSLATIILTFTCTFSFAQGVMISNDPAAPEPAALLHTYGVGEGDGNVLFQGEFKDPVFQGGPPATGSGTRFMWHPDMAAIRAGQVTGTQWNLSFTGEHSIAMGYNTTARGDYSLAVGNSAQALSVSSVALGHFTTASQAHTTALGFQTTASGAYSTATGSWTIAPSGFETAIGRYNTTYTPLSSAGWLDGDRLFVIGNGTSVSTRSDALVVLKNGNIGVGVSNPDNYITVKLRPGKAGIKLLDNDNYFQSNLWQFGSTASNPDQGVYSGDFVLKSATEYHFTYWVSYFRPTTDNTKTLGGSGYRWSTVYAANGVINTSDAREKQNIRPTAYGLDAVMKMKPVSFEWKDRPEEGNKLGFLAQDLLKVIPEVVVTKEKVTDRESDAVSYKDAKTLGVYYSDIIPVLVKAIQEQQELINKQQMEIEALKVRFGE
jgi:hypothetical protein